MKKEVIFLENLKNKNGRIALIISALAIIIIAILIGGYLYINNSKPKNVFISQINKTIDNFDSKSSTVKDKINTTVTLSGKIETENEQLKETAKIINDSKLAVNVQADTKTQKASITLDIDYLNEKFFDGSLYYENGDNNIYLFVEELFNKYLKVDISKSLDEETKEQINSLFSDNSQSFGEKLSLKKVERILKREINDKLAEKYFSKENIDGMTKNTISIKLEEIKKILKEIAIELEKDDDFLGSYKNPEDIKQTLEALIKASEKATEYDQYNVEISLYTNGLLNKEVKKIELKVVMAENQSAMVTFNKIDNNTIEFFVNVDMVENNVNVKAEALKGTIKSEKIDNNTEKTTLEIDNIPEVGKIILNMEVKNEDETTLDNIDKSNSVDVNNLSEADQMTIFTNLVKSKIYNVISPYVGI